MTCPVCHQISDQPMDCQLCGKPACAFCLVPEGKLAVCQKCMTPREYARYPVFTVRKDDAQAGAWRDIQSNLRERIDRQGF